MTKRLDPDRPNKARRGRPPKPRKNSLALKALWANPERRAQMIAKLKAARAIQDIERAINPDKFSRAGIPHGHTRATAAPLWAEARRKADRFIQKMADEGLITPPELLVPDSDEAKAVAALHEVAKIAFGPGDKQLKHAASRTILEYCKAKPTTKSNVTINSSEDWLAEIAADDAKDA